MAKLFIFAIGGTGSRVVKALTFLLASGIKLENVSTVVPIIVDPHKGNLDLLRTEDLLKKYHNIRSQMHTPPAAGEFFGTDVKTLKEIVPGETSIGNSYTFQLKGVSNSKFSDYIDYLDLDKKIGQEEPYHANKDLVDLLFSKENLDTSMDIGFVGNPNIGSVVLNQFEESEEYKQFAANFQQGDRIFIISSIFGGTGAAGFPVILKNIRNAHLSGVATPLYLKNAPIGAITVLPYFGLAPNEGNQIDQATFYSKTKAALQYYNRGINKLVNRLYYVGDSTVKNFEYDPGANGQKNDAHFVELSSALAVIDFCNTPSAYLNVQDGLPEETVYKEYSIKNDVESFSMTNLANSSNRIFGLSLSKFHLFWMFTSSNLQANLSEAWLEASPKIDNSFFSDTFYKDNLKPFLDAYKQWLDEMKTNKRGFMPFRLEGSLDQLFEGFEPKKGLLVSKPSFDQLNNIASKHCKTIAYPNGKDKLLKAFAYASAEFISEKFPSMYSSLH